MNNVFVSKTMDDHAQKFHLKTGLAKYDHFSWICGDEVKNTYFCWPCLVMGDRQKVRLCFIEFYCKAVDTFYVFESPELKKAAHTIRSQKPIVWLRHYMGYNPL